MFVKILSFLLLVTLSVAHTVDLFQNYRIIGGHTTTIDQLPYQVSLIYNGSPLCGGSIIATKYILTAAHCTQPLQTPTQLRIRAGSSFHKSGGTLDSVAQIFQHKQYDPNSLDNDISILLLTKPLVFSKMINKINLPFQGESIQNGLSSVVSGWGVYSKTHTESSLQLQYVRVPIVDDNVCAKAYSNVHKLTRNMLCAGLYRIGGKDACQGDSGGPLVAKSKQYGVVSWGMGCALPNYPGVYTRVSNYRNWIDSIIQH